MATQTIPFRDGETWYTVSEPGGAAAGRPPLLALHGGPGTSHDYLRTLTELVEDRPVVLYDQFGTGNSSHRPDWAAERWSVGLFLDQLTELVAHLGLGRGFHLLGHSWGGMLAQEYALTRPAGLRSLVLSDTNASAAAIMDSINALRDAIAAEEQDEEKQGALFATRHICRVEPMPEDLVRTFALLGENPGVNLAMMGMGEREIEGNLRGWDAVPRLPGIDVPTLVLAGEFDELQPVAWGPLAELIPGARSHVFAGASHTPFFESPQEYREVLGAFLTEHDGGGS